MEKVLVPLKTGERIPALDGLRGIALMGILLINIYIFNAPYFALGEFYTQYFPNQLVVGRLDLRTVWRKIHVPFFFSVWIWDLDSRA